MTDHLHAQSILGTNHGLQKTGSAVATSKANEARRLNVEIDKTRAIYEGMREYQHQLLANKLQADLSISKEDASVLFDDIKRFIAMCTSTSQPLAPPRSIDLAWHQFILMTKDYRSFCNDYCGRFIHHLPADPFEARRDFVDARQQTRLIAKAVYGQLSDNWAETLSDGQCTHNCGGGDCDGE